MWQASHREQAFIAELILTGERFELFSLRVFLLRWLKWCHIKLEKNDTGQMAHQWSKLHLSGPCLDQRESHYQHTSKRTRWPIGEGRRLSFFLSECSELHKAVHEFPIVSHPFKHDFHWTLLQELSAMWSYIVIAIGLDDSLPPSEATRSDGEVVVIEIWSILCTEGILGAWVKVWHNLQMPHWPWRFITTRRITTRVP